MMTEWSEIDPWVVAVSLGIGMTIGGALGWWRGKVVRGEGEEKCATSFDGAVMTLLGLLLAFTFSMALMKHEARRTAAVLDSNAIGDFTSCVGLLDGSMRDRLRAVLRQYIEVRLTMADPSTTGEAFERHLYETQKMQSDMHALVKESVQDGTPVTVPLVMTFNGLTSAHASRLAAVRDRLPPHVELMLLLTSIITVSILGKRYGTAGERRLGAMGSYIVVVCLVVWVTLDLDQPRRGWIRVNQEPLQRLLQSF